MDVNNHLFDMFPATSKEEWIQQVIRDLKGGDFNTILKYTSGDNIKILPFYTAEDLSGYTERKPLFAHTDWEICEEIEVTDETAANKKALSALETGATGLVFHVDGQVALPRLLQDIGIPYIRLQFQVRNHIEAFDAQLKTYLAAHYPASQAPDLSVCYDPIHTLVESGNREQLTGYTAGDQQLCVNGAIYHNAGAPPAYELACVLAHANEYLNLRNGDTERIQINIAVGPDYFFEIAKLRAYRRLFALLTASWDKKPALYIHAETALRNMTLYDAHNNLLRTTTEAMAATIGGCNSLTVKPFDYIYSEPNDLSGRLARNIQLILKAESYFDKVADVSAGSFFIETLTEQLAQKAWDYFKEIEQDGGFLKSLEQGIIQQKTETAAASRQQRFDEGKEILVGTNKYPDMKQAMKQKLAKNIQAPKGSNDVLTVRRLSLAGELERLQQEEPVSS